MEEVNYNQIFALQDSYIQECYDASKKAGWYENDNSKEFVFAKAKLLICSEIIEAMEGYRRNWIKDEKLSHVTQFSAELADIAMRINNFFGFVIEHHPELYSLHDYDLICRYDAAYDSIVRMNSFATEEEAMVNIFNDMLERVSCAKISNVDLNFQYVFYLVHMLHEEYSPDNDLELYDVIDMKLEFNKDREDHKVENRTKQGGKRF